MPPRMSINKQPTRIAVAEHAWSAASSGTSDAKRYLSFPAGARIEIVGIVTKQEEEIRPEDHAQ